MMDGDNLSQTEVAELMDVDRCTIARWQRQGMPFTPPTKNGLPASHVFSVVLYWHLGHLWAQQHKQSLTPGQKIAVGWTAHLDGEPNDDEASLFAGLLEKAQVNESPERLLGYAIAQYAG